MSKVTSPTSPASPRIVEEGNVVAEITNDGVTTTANVTEGPDFNYGDEVIAELEEIEAETPVLYEALAKER